jgi:hypothetical protein
VTSGEAGAKGADKPERNTNIMEEKAKNYGTAMKNTHRLGECFL